MSKKMRPPFNQLAKQIPAQVAPRALAHGELLKHMEPGREYESLLKLQNITLDLVTEIRLAVADIQKIRNRPLLVYAANVINRAVTTDISINTADDLPYCEMVRNVPANYEDVDILVVTPGGSGQQVAQFVHNTRQRFKNVGFIVPHMAMSAGTIWALASEEIWMSQRGYLGPIDPQVPGRDGRLLPAQAIHVLIKEIQARGLEAIKKGEPPSWSDQMLLRDMDPKEIGNAISQSKYSIQLAQDYLKRYKFKLWNTHSSTQQPVTDTEKQQRAMETASKLCAHEVWKAHSHGISRDVLNSDELRLKIDRPETIPGFDEALNRLWAVLYWSFEHTNVIKVILSEHYAVVRSETRS